MAEYLVETRKYLKSFFDAKIREYHEASTELRPEKGYGFYYRNADVTQALRNIVGNISEHFDDLRIPERFSSPQRLLDTLVGFQQLLLKQNNLLMDIIKYFQGTREPPYPVYECYRINNEVLDAISFALSLDEARDYSGVSKNVQINETEALRRVHVILDKFTVVSHQLTQRRREGDKPRDTILISDEYDVQDLLHALLKIDFDDIRAEEWTPSYAGGASRMDFLLKKHHIVIEVKMTRKGLADRETGEQLLVDIVKYQAHPDCKHLIAFIHDPERRIKNPAGLVGDIESKKEKIDIKVVIRPQ